MNGKVWGVVIRGPGLGLHYIAPNYADVIQYIKGCAAVAPFKPGTIATITGPIGGTRRYALRGSTLAELKDAPAVRGEEAKRPRLLPPGGLLDFSVKKS